LAITPVVFVCGRTMAMHGNISSQELHIQSENLELGLGYEMPCGPCKDGMDPVTVAKEME